MERRNYNNSNGDYHLAFTHKGHIEHHISRFDTLAGIAIKYGVEVADIKKMNGLATDLQMFARKSIQIPLPGKHPPSPCLTNGSESSWQNSSQQIHHVQCDIFDSFKSLRLTSSSSEQKVLQAMSSLQGFYGLKSTNQMAIPEGFEMAVYGKGEGNDMEDCSFLGPSAALNLPLGLRQKSRSLANGLVYHKGDLVDNVTCIKETESNKRNEKLVRRRQKSESDFTCATTPEMFLKEENSTMGGFSAITGRGLAQRQKAASRTAVAADGEGGGLNPIPVGLGDYLLAERLCGVRRSSSMSNLQDQDGSNSSVRPASRWCLKPDLQALSSAAITKPIFDGLPKPISGKRNKAALD